MTDIPTCSFICLQASTGMYSSTHPRIFPHDASQSTFCQRPSYQRLRSDEPWWLPEQDLVGEHRKVPGPVPRNPSKSPVGLTAHRHRRLERINPQLEYQHYHFFGRNQEQKTWRHDIVQVTLTDLSISWRIPQLWKLLLPPRETPMITAPCCSRSW